MKDFVDLNGASGASYRYRLRREGEPHLRIAGTYAVLEPRAGGLAVHFIGATNDLAQAQAACPEGSGNGAGQLYIRLNVSRSAREAEREDLLANYGLAPSGEAACLRLRQG